MYMLCMLYIKRFRTIFQIVLVKIIAKIRHNKIIILPLQSSANGFDAQLNSINSRINCSFSNFKSHSRHRFLL
jgi:hypothetical protein